MDGGRELHAEVDQRDMIRWDLTYKRKSWPASTEAPFIFQAFLAWSALTRAGDLTLTVEEFFDQVISIREDGATPLGPTPAAAGPGWSSRSP